MIALLASKAVASAGNDVAWTPAVLTAAIAGAVALVSWALNAVVSAIRADRARRTDAFSKAFVATVAYAEFPYVVRRRNPTDAAAERIRISDALREIQQEIAYYEAWLQSESPDVGRAYVELVAATRQTAGTAIQDAWLAPPASSDADMNMPDLGQGALQASRRNYLVAVTRSLRPFRTRLRRSSGSAPVPVGPAPAT